jgi:2-polyprenyl-3-methyl-5-hydroxy-6-metoxy-1,4-benzoquinol methylase
MIGKELLFSSNLTGLEKLYILLFGVPICGLRIRARRVLPLVKNGCANILDAGCGTGIFTFALARKFPDSMVTGIDIDDALIVSNKEVSKKTGIKNCSFITLDICQSDFAELFDLVISIDNLEHVENDELALKNLYKSIIKGGRIIIHVPGFYRRWFFFRWKVNFHVDGHFRHGYTKEQILNKVKKAGFKVSDAYYTYGWMETIANNISYLITKAEMKNKFLYALIFPFLNFFSYFGRNALPEKGAGVIVIAIK